MLHQVHEYISHILTVVVDWAWGPPLVILLIGGGLVLIGVSRLLPLRGFVQGLRLMSGRFHHPGDETAEGQITHFQALSNALAATVGMGNIAGVAIAVAQGGAGAVFWMWVTALVGMNTKFFECTLAVMYRGKDHTGQVQGGPMYVIETALGRRCKPLAVFFAVCGLVGTLTLFQINQVASFLHDSYFNAVPTLAQFDATSNLSFPIDRLIVGVIIASVVAYILLGGIRRLAHVTAAMVPTMCLFYVLVSLYIIAVHFDRVPTAFGAIFSHAFSGQAALGGAEGFAFSRLFTVMQVGVKRAAFSNEAGIGTAPMAHSNVKTREPISEGLVAMVGPFLDTIVVCTMTALVLLVSLEPTALADAVNRKVSGVVITSMAFEQTLPGLGKHFLGVAVFLFGFTTMVGYANYNAKCWHYLFKGRLIFGHRTFVAVYAVSLVVGAIAQQGDVINILDTSFALMAIPTMLSTLILAPRVKRALGVYLDTYCRRRR